MVRLRDARCFTGFLNAASAPADGVPKESNLMLNHDLQRQQLRQRARELVPVLRERAPDAAQQG
ncbi:hypothetical protein SAMN04487857_111163 [Pseudomonas sp. ok272]|nr:hypothetical protein SAMN04487857_111163 [Pseudomonas sp. ok272]SFN12078.1 hypothetical protein SAMN04487858_112163 [Pseudomonas sp. ok602]